MEEAAPESGTMWVTLCRKCVMCLVRFQVSFRCVTFQVKVGIRNVGNDTPAENVGTIQIVQCESDVAMYSVWSSTVNPLACLKLQTACLPLPWQQEVFPVREGKTCGRVTGSGIV